jgi:hypothetical protein
MLEIGRRKRLPERLEANFQRQCTRPRFGSMHLTKTEVIFITISQLTRVLPTRIVRS